MQCDLKGKTVYQANTSSQCAHNVSLYVTSLHLESLLRSDVFFLDVSLYALAYDLYAFPLSCLCYAYCKSLWICK